MYLHNQKQTTYSSSKNSKPIKEALQRIIDKIIESPVFGFSSLASAITNVVVASPPSVNNTLRLYVFGVKPFK